MKKKLNILFFLIMVFLHGCGFEPILSSNNNNKAKLVLIDEVNFINYNELNNLFLRKFRYFQKDDSNLKKYNITLDINNITTIVSKNKLGDPETFNIEIVANIIIFNSKNDILNSKTIRKDKNYNNLDNKFDLKQDENIIKNNLVEEIVDEILNTLLSIE